MVGAGVVVAASVVVVVGEGEVVGASEVVVGEGEVVVVVGEGEVVGASEVVDVAAARSKAKRSNRGIPGSAQARARTRWCQRRQVSACAGGRMQVESQRHTTRQRPDSSFWQRCLARRGMLPRLLHSRFVRIERAGARRYPSLWCLRTHRACCPLLRGPRTSACPGPPARPGRPGSTIRFVRDGQRKADAAQDVLRQFWTAHRVMSLRRLSPSNTARSKCSTRCRTRTRCRLRPADLRTHTVDGGQDRTRPCAMDTSWPLGSWWFAWTAVSGELNNLGSTSPAPRRKCTVCLVIGCV